MRPRTAAEQYLAQRRSDPAYERAYEAASRRIGMFDDVVRSLDARRQELGMSKAELARRADMPPAVVRRLFSQQHKNPTLTTLVAIADALDLRFCTASAQMAPQGSMLDIGAPDSPASIQAPLRASGTRRRTA